MTRQKYIGTKEAVRLTGLSTEEIYDIEYKNSSKAPWKPQNEH